SETTTFTLVVSDGTFTDTDNRTTVVSTARGAEVAISSAAVSPTNTFSITITFNEAVTGFLESEITVGNGTASAFNAVSTTVYTATITPAANGVVTVDINADVAQDVSTYGNQAAAQFSITADITSPTITSVSVPANATYKTGDNLNFTINTSENVTVNTGSGVPSLAVTIGSTVRQATFDSGSGTQALAFRYQVVSGDEDTNGIVIGTLDLNSGTMKDVAGNDLVLALNSVGSTTSVLVDGVLPSTTSFTRKTPVGQATNADQVVFLATFSEAVTGVDLNDFAVTGPTGASIAVAQVTTSTYDVTISGGDMANLNATVGLNFAGAPTITDVAGNALPNTEPGTDETYILDNTAPSTTSFTRKTPVGQATNADQVVFLATFSEAVTGVDLNDFAVTGP
ncbi:Ig-like domain-containing protein, partial [Rheinheimera sp.]|uniref:Ig-like domain-containing protein n=1 Tax=Rheinheimera sp. TaxID=1869214 RepID=UPI004047BEF2